MITFYDKSVLCHSWTRFLALRCSCQGWRKLDKLTNCIPAPQTVPWLMTGLVGSSALDLQNLSPTKPMCVQQDSELCRYFSLTEHASRRSFILAAPCYRSASAIDQVDLQSWALTLKICPGLPMYYKYTPYKYTTPGLPMSIVSSCQMRNDIDHHQMWCILELRTWKIQKNRASRPRLQKPGTHSSKLSSQCAIHQDRCSLWVEFLSKPHKEVMPWSIPEGPVVSLGSWCQSGTLLGRLSKLDWRNLERLAWLTFVELFGWIWTM